jgi:predicted nuclease of predicted toxin-antitoxin system
MRFLIDECTGPLVARWFRESGYEVYSVYEESRGIDDESILKKAFNEEWVIITNDKDFGDMIFREKKRHRGVILLRLENEVAANKIKILSYVLENHKDEIEDGFIIATEKRIRIIK